MEFRILGPLEVRDQGQPLPLTAAKQRALLAILLVHAGEVVSKDRLIDELWGAQPPASAANALQVYVTQLRRILEPERKPRAPSAVLPASAGGYLIGIGAGELDAQRFERQSTAAVAAREAGDHGGAAEGLRRALEIWRGPALVDFTYEPFAQAEIARLEELRLIAVEERIEADLALGRHAALVGELEALVETHPLRERLRGQLMLALYRAGRQAEAVEAYRTAHSVLMDELGIAPNPALQELERAILRQSSALEAPSRVPPVGVGTGPTAGVESSPSAESRRTVTILVLERATEDAVDLEARRQLEQRELQATTAVIERYGGKVESVLGSTLMASFGVPLAHEDDATRAVHAASELSSRPNARCGIATGEILVDASRGNHLPLTGAPVTEAAGLASHAADGEVLIAGQTRALLRGTARMEAADHPPAWRLVELLPKLAPLSQPPAAPLIGRELELGQLNDAVDRVRAEGTVHLFTILGAPGIGKSRLGQELAWHLAGEATVLAGRCLPYGEGITFWPLREILGESGAQGPAAEAVGHAIAGDPSIGREEIFLAFLRLLESIARERPVVVVFEDLHWAEPTLLDLIAYLAERGRGVPILLLCLARPELLEQRPTWAVGKPNTGSLLLERLTDPEAEELIDRLAPELDAATRLRVQDVAEGNPLFLSQILALLAEEGPPAGEIPIPATIQAILAARLDRLGPGERAAVERAAVIGKELWAGAVATLLPERARPFAARHLEALVRKEMLSPARSVIDGEDALRFRHVLIQQAAYRAVPKPLRASLHQEFADWLEGVDGASEYAEIAGYHLEQAHRLNLELGASRDQEHELGARAADLLALAGRRAFGRGDMPASVGLLERASSLLPDDAAEAPRLRSDLGYALFEIGEIRGADAALAQAEVRARETGDRATELSAMVKRGNLSLYTDTASVDLDELERQTERAIEELARLGDDSGLSRAWTALSEVLYLTGRLLEAGRATELAAEHARRVGSRREEAWAMGQYGFCLIEGPTPVPEAIARLERVLADADENPVMAANLNGFLAVQEAMGGRIADARARMAIGLSLTRDLGLRWQAGIHSLLGGYVEQLCGDPAAAERAMLEAQEVFREIDDRWFLSTVAVDLPRPVYQQGRFEDAWALVEAIDLWPAPSDLEWQLKRRGVPALLLARSGLIEEAALIAREAVLLGSESEFVHLRGWALRDLAEVYRIAGQISQASEAAASALRVCESKGNQVGAADARSLVAELGR